MEIRWLVLPLILGLAACGTQPVKIRTETVEVQRPILYCPAVDFTEAGRPESLPIDGITATTPDGEVAVRYKATVKALLDYTERLELLMEQYGEFNKSYEELIQELNLENNE